MNSTGKRCSASWREVPVSSRGDRFSFLYTFCYLTVICVTFSRCFKRHVRASEMLRILKFCGAVILNTFVAVIGSAILEGIGTVFHPHSIAALLWKEWSLSLLCAAFIGFSMWRTWRTSAAKYAWILP